MKNQYLIRFTDHQYVPSLLDGTLYMGSMQKYHDTVSNTVDGQADIFEGTCRTISKDWIATVTDEIKPEDLTNDIFFIRDSQCHLAKNF